MVKYFIPESDITAYELATIFNRIMPGKGYAAFSDNVWAPLRIREVFFNSEDFYALSNSIKRHFKDKQQAFDVPKVTA